MAALRMILVAVFAWARRSCVHRAKKEDSRKIPLVRRTKVSTHREAENIKVEETGVSAWPESIHLTQEARWHEEGRGAFEWFLGRNYLGARFTIRHRWVP
jgi:hypothetical protein